MRFPLIVLSRLPVSAMALYPFILLDRPERRSDIGLLRHERIHLRQQAELLVLPFYLLYGYYYLQGLLRGRSSREAYREIPFEREAYAQEHEPLYLERRMRFAWRGYR
jgi:hypothetical protein